MNTAILAAIAALLGTGAAVALRRKPKPASLSSTTTPKPTPTPTPSDVEPAGVPADLLNLFEAVADAAKWPELPKFLAAVSWTESRWHADARSSAGAIGLFQLKPASANLAAIGQPASVLTDPRWNTVLYVWYLARLRNYAAGGQVIDWLALRRGGAYPKLVADTGELEQRSRDVRSRLEQALAHIGLPIEFEHEPAFPEGWTWPGLPPLLAAAGLGDVA
jgi:soluble lytic murein transglycosylase-like protein